MVAAGCQRNDPVEPDIDLPVSPPAAALKYEKLEDLPAPVSQAFLRQYPNAAVTGVEARTASTGEVLYEVVFIQNGDAQQVLYDRDGKVVRAPQRTNRR